MHHVMKATAKNEIKTLHNIYVKFIQEFKDCMILRNAFTSGLGRFRGRHGRPSWPPAPGMKRGGGRDVG